MKVLILASNPRKDLNLEGEIRHLQEAIERARNREYLEVEIGLAVRPEDLQGLFLKHEPEIVHFCGHGTGKPGLVLQDDTGLEKLVSTDALSKLFELCSGWVRCVLLNACYSEVQANAMVQHINYAIGMNHEIRDDAAIAFATGFYQALGYGQPIEQAYKFGRNAIQLQISGNSNVRSVLSEEKRKLAVATAVEKVVIPEHLKPVLKIKPNLTASPDESTPDARKNLVPSTKLDLQSYIDKALEKEIALRQYPQDKECLADKNIRRNPHSSLPKKTRTLFVVVGLSATLVLALILKFSFSPERGKDPSLPSDPSSTSPIDSSLPSPIFSFYYGDKPNPGLRKWYELDNGNWIEKEPDEKIIPLSFVKKSANNIQGINIKGIILKKTDGSDTEIFVPDKESGSQSLYWRHKDDPKWPDWTEFPGKITYY